MPFSHGMQFVGRLARELALAGGNNEWFAAGALALLQRAIQIEKSDRPSR